ncbi:MAG: hypothetical protein AAB846_00650, partial [Patescibacteria group bacterium]
RMEDIAAYADRIEELTYVCNWRPFYHGEEFHRFNDLAAVEHFPIHLIRKILGQKGCLPCPDTAPNILRAFEGSPNKKMARLRELFRPFYVIDAGYTKLIADISQHPTDWTEERYIRNLFGQLFRRLPITELADFVKQMYTWPDPP